MPVIRFKKQYTVFDGIKTCAFHRASEMLFVIRISSVLGKLKTAERIIYKILF